MESIAEIWPRTTSKLPMIYQGEITECGLACIAMIAGFFAYRVDLTTLRQRAPISMRGANLGSLVRIAKSAGLASRALKLNLDELCDLKLPCILHWNMNHFVVLQSVSKKKITIHDPAQGVRVVDWIEASRSFTGIALELWPDAGFRKKDERKRISLREVLGTIDGLPRAIMHVFTLAVVLECCAVFAPFYMQAIVDHVILSGDRDLLTILGIGFCFLVLLQNAISALRSWLVLTASTSLSVQWRANVFSHLLRLPILFFERRSLGDISSRFESIETIRRTLSASFIEAIIDGIMSIITLAILLMYSVPLTLVAVLSVFFYYLWRMCFQNRLRMAIEKQIVSAAQQESCFLETVRAVKSIKLFCRETERRGVWLSLLVENVRAEILSQRLQIAFRLGNGIIFGLENVFLIWLGALFVLSSELSVGALLAIVAYKNQFVTRVSGLIDKVIEFRMLHIQTERLAEIVFAEADHNCRPEDVTDAACEGDGVINVRDLCFRYSHDDDFILTNVNFNVRVGESVALVGASGAGKTTLLNVLLGILQPTSGTVEMGAGGATASGKAMRGVIGTVLQDDVLLSGTVADNICFFDTSPDLAWIEECSRIACVYEEICLMPMRFRTLIGELGTVLSGGQKQRILLARALYRRPTILVLDEATSHLDVEKEREVNSRIRSLNITRLMIAHRPETIASAERVLLLKNGTISEVAKGVRTYQTISVMPTDKLLARMMTM